MRLNLAQPRIILERPELAVTAINDLFALVESLRRELTELQREFQTASARSAARERKLTEVEARMRELENELKRMLRAGPPPAGGARGRGGHDIYGGEQFDESGKHRGR